MAIVMAISNNRRWRRPSAALGFQNSVLPLFRVFAIRIGTVEVGGRARVVILDSQYGSDGGMRPRRGRLPRVVQTEVFRF